MDIKIPIVIIIAVLIAGTITYLITTANFNEELSLKQEKITTLERSIMEAKQPPPPTIVPETNPPTIEDRISEEVINCLLCHDLTQTKSFHFPQTIMKIEEAAGTRRRVCVDCHGPLAFDDDGNFLGWSADEQRTPLGSIEFDPTDGVNGKFILPNQVVHSIHKRTLDSGAIKCEFCHVPPGATVFIKPRVKTELGRVLYCQNEGCHDDEGGNYIGIHIEIRPFKCTTCHTGSIVQVHIEETKKLGQL
jgi:hypothetical protein